MPPSKKDASQKRAPKKQASKKGRTRSARPARAKKDKALRDLVKELGGKKAAKRLGKSEKTIASWQKRGVPKASAEGVIRALERRAAAKRGSRSRKEKRDDEWHERREELLAQRDSPVTNAKQVVGIKLNLDGMVLGWGPGGVLLRLYAVVSRLTGDRQWFWTPAQYLAGYDEVEQFVEFYEIDPSEFDVELFFDDLLTEAERMAGGLVF